MVTKLERHTIAIRVLACLSLLAGCGPRVVADHCLFQGGDRWCHSEESCFVVIGGGVIAGADQGCVELPPGEAPDPEHFLHLEHGLPGSLSDDGEILEADTVRGVLARAGGCSALEDLSTFESQMESELQVMFAARARLDRLRELERVRDERAFLDVEEAEAITEFNERVQEWAMSCGQVETGTSDSGSSESTTMDDPAHTTEDACAGGLGCVDPWAPFCELETGNCVSCDSMPDPDRACAEHYPTARSCVDGVCV